MIVQYLECDIARSSGHIKHPHNLLFLMRVNPARSQYPKFLNEVILPVAMYSHRHEIVHYIVLVGNRVEDLIHQGLLLFGGDLDKTEVVVLVSAEGRKAGEEFGELACDQHDYI